METLEVKTLISEINNSLNSFISKLNKTQTKQDVWDNDRWSNICIIKVPEGEGRQIGAEEIFKEIITENFPN